LRGVGAGQKNLAWDCRQVFSQSPAVLTVQLGRKIVDQNAALALGNVEQNLDLGQSQSDDQHLVLPVRGLFTAGVFTQPDPQVVAMRTTVGKAPCLIAAAIPQKALG